ncbi:hypothetical protein FS749_007925 [Ceratobasidium sp. UAMH 11750]|nr:hypothetical protein FS749_007925 [Ceratobasidium sp. UAMH 11750]
MGKTPWTSQELAWFDARIPDWLKVRDGPLSHVPVNGIRPPVAFIRFLADNFLGEFEQRKWSAETSYGFQTREEYRANLIEKFRTLMNNRAREKVAAKTHAGVPKMAKSTTARQLAMKEFNVAIRARAAEMRAENSVVDSRTVWNFATTEVLKQMQEDDPSAVARIQEKALAIREAASVNFAEQNEDVLKKLLDMLPKRMLSTAHEWSRTTGASLYFAAIYDTKEDGLQFVDACSPDIERYRISKACEGFRHDFSEFVCRLLGVSMTKTLENARPQVYPDRAKDYRPCLPVLNSLPHRKVELLKDLLRMYFNQLWKWQGGHGATPYKLIAEDCLTGHWTFVERQRVPENVMMLQDPSRMLAAELTIWYEYIERGQTGGLLPANVFQFALLTKADHSTIAQYSTLCNHRHPRSRLEWDGEQVLFARKVEASADAGANTSSWNGLPVARLVHTYEPFTRRQRQQMTEFSTSEYNLDALVDLVEQIERLGPAHENDRSHAEINPHLPGDLNVADIDSLFQRIWPHIAYFDETHDDHPQYAAITLLYWLKSLSALKHIPSNTWVGGPAGCCWIVVLIFHLVKAMTMIDRRTDAPDNLPAIFSEDLQQRHWHHIKAMFEWLNTEWQATCSTLRTSFDARSQAWKEQVKSVMESNNRLRSGILVAGAPVIQAAHYALPIELADLHECYKAITGDSQETAEQAITPPARQPRQRRPRESPSAECITLPEFGSDISRSQLSPLSEPDELVSLANRTVHQEDSISRTPVKRQKKAEIAAILGPPFHRSIQSAPHSRQNTSKPHEPVACPD